MTAPDTLPGFGPQGMQDLYRALFQSAYDAHYVLDAGRDELLMVNDAFLRITGFTREQLVGSGLKTLSIIAPEQRDEILAKRKALGTVPTSSYEVRIVTPKGRRVLEICVRRIELEGRSLVLGTGRDVTERHRSRRHQEALLELSRLSHATGDAVRTVLERVAETLEVERVSLWRFDPERTSIRCEDLFVRGKGGHESGLVLEARRYPAYFKAMEAARVIAADAARTDPRTREFADGYLVPNAITSMMDVGIRVQGSLAGVLCHEHVGPERSWSEEEQAFATAVADRLSALLEAAESRRSEEALRSSEERFRHLSEATTEGIAISEKGRILYTNFKLAAMYGYEPSEIMGKEIVTLVAPESRDLVAKHIQSGAEKTYEAVGLRKDGSTFPYEVTGKTFESEGRTLRMAAVRDLTKVKQLSATLEREVRLEKKKTLEAFQANVRIFQLTEKIRAAYESTTKLVNSRNIEELLGSAVALLCDPAGLDYREATIYTLRDGKLESLASFPEHQPSSIPCDSDHPLALAFREQPGRPADTGGLALPLKGQAGPLGLLEVRFHSTEEVRSWQENILRTLANSVSLMIDNLNLYEMVRRQSITDVLTGAHNRRYFDDKLKAEVERAVRYKRSMALIMVDLDGFKGINDTAGHPQGDAVLAELGAILRKQSRQIDIVSRYGGDEFSIILPETPLENAVLHADRIREMVAARTFPNRHDPAKPFRITLSVGVADVDGDRRTAESLLDAADRACFLAKRQGKNRVRSVRDLGEGGTA